MTFLLIVLLPLLLLLLIYLIFKLIQRLSFTPYKHISAATNLPSTSRLTILQMNVFWRPRLIHLFHNEYVSERSRLLAALLSPFDFVCLNEAFHFGSRTVSDFVSLIKSHGFDYVVSSDHIPLLSYRVMDSGLLIASKLPIVSTDSMVYTIGCSVDRMAAKGSVYAKIQIGPIKFIHVFATHLQASYKAVNSVDFGVRVGQSMELQDFIVSKTKDDDALIFLLGDMNVDSIGEKEEYRRLMETLRIEGYELIDTLREKGHPVTIRAELSGDEKDESIDYVLIYQKNREIVKYEAALEPFRIEGREFGQLSDHLGVQCLIELAS